MVNLFGPPQGSFAFPLQAMLQSESGAAVDEPKLFPQ
jgi:hypothetical protein